MSVNDIVPFILEVLGLYGLWRALLWWYRSGSRQGSFIVKGITYSYVVGDSVGYDPINGVEILLPKALPNIYIDGHTGDRGVGPRYMYPYKYRLMLEGDFNKYFQVYALPEYHALILSILQPDVMATLIDAVAHYDVEFLGDRLRIISTHGRIYNKPAKEAAVLRASQAILEEVASRLNSWREADAKMVNQTAMVPYRNQTLKFGRHRVASDIVVSGVVFAVFGLPLTACSIWALHNPDPNVSAVRWLLLAMGLAVFPVFWIAFMLLDRRGWLRWFQR